MKIGSLRLFEFYKKPDGFIVDLASWHWSNSITWRWRISYQSPGRVMETFFWKSYSRNHFTLSIRGLGVIVFRKQSNFFYNDVPAYIQSEIARQNAQAMMDILP